MPKTDTIRTPLTHRLRRFMRTSMPVLGFVGMVLLTGWLWQKERFVPNAVGTVEALRAEISSGSAGTIEPLEHLETGWWSLFDKVQQGDIVFRLDDARVRLSLATMQKELRRIRLEVAAEASRLLREDRSLEMDDRKERVRLAWQLEQNRLDYLDRRVAIEVDRIEKQRLDALLKSWEPLAGTDVITEEVLRDTKLKRDVVAKRIETNMTVSNEINQQRKRSIERIQKFSPLEKLEHETLLAPLRAAIAVQEARMEELASQVKSLIVRAPFSGTIATIYKYPGQSIAAGEPVVTIAGERGRYIISYLRQRNVPPKIGATVHVRIRSLGARRMKGVIERIGPQVEPIPTQHLSAPTTPEWGVPVQISIPDGFSARPGELVDLSFVRSE